MTTRQQIESSSASVDKQFANERTQRETERMAEHLELVIAVDVEAELNIKIAKHARSPTMIEFMNRLPLSGRLMGDQEVAPSTRAALAAQRYNSALASMMAANTLPDTYPKGKVFTCPRGRWTCTGRGPAPWSAVTTTSERQRARPSDSVS